MKICLVHGWGDSPNSEAWFGWLKNECKKRNIQLIMPKMPETDNPVIENWIGKLKQIINPDNETILIGHSIGCQTILRYLETLPSNIKIKGCVFVAGWFNLLETAYESEKEKSIAKPWLETPINFEKIKTHCNNFLAIFSTDDDCIPINDSKLFKEKLNAKIIIKQNQGHFNETQKIPEIIEFIENEKSF